MAFEDLDEEQLIMSVALIVFGASVLAIVDLASVEIMWSETTYVISNMAAEVGFVALAALAVLGGRSLDGMESWELVAVVVGIGVLLSVGFVPELQNYINGEYSPWSNVGAAALGYVGAWRLAFGGS